MLYSVPERNHHASYMVPTTVERLAPLIQISARLITGVSPIHRLYPNLLISSSAIYRTVMAKDLQAFPIVWMSANLLEWCMVKGFLAARRTSDPPKRCEDDF